MKPDERFDPPEPDTSRSRDLVTAFRALETGTADRAQGALIIRYLAEITAYGADMRIGSWIKDTGSAAGYEQACIEHVTKRWVFNQILPYLSAHPDGRVRAEE